MVLSAAMFIAGLLSWTLLEYIIHGSMAHLHNTFITPIHAVHHRDPRAVFAIGAWLPSAMVALVLPLAFGWAPGVVFYEGLLCGFITYEVVHYRLHFARALTAYERRLRSRHLVHHLRRPRKCLGVVSSFWDRLFGTEPGREELAELCRSVQAVQPLSGCSNIHQLVTSLVSGLALKSAASDSILRQITRAGSQRAKEKTSKTPSAMEGRWTIRP